MRELTDAELISTFKNTEVKLHGRSALGGGGNTGHGLTRLRDPRIKALGVNTPNDIARILNKGSNFQSTVEGTIGRQLNGVAVVLDAKTFNLVTVTPTKK